MVITVASLKNKYPAICRYLSLNSDREREVNDVLKEINDEQAEHLFGEVFKAILEAKDGNAVRAAFSLRVSNIVLLAKVDAAVSQLARHLLTDPNALALQAAVKTEHVLAQLHQPWRDELKQKNVDLSKATPETIKAFNKWVRSSENIASPLFFVNINTQISTLAAGQAKQLQAFGDQTGEPAHAESMVALAADNLSANFAERALKNVQAYKLLNDLISLAKNTARYKDAKKLEQFVQALNENKSQCVAALVALPQLPAGAQAALDQLLADGESEKIVAALKTFGVNAQADSGMVRELAAEAAAKKLINAQQQYDALLAKPELKPVGNPDPVLPRPALFKALNDHSDKIKANLAANLNEQTTVLFNPASSFNEIKAALIAMGIPDRAAGAAMPAADQPDDVVSLTGKVVVESIIIEATRLADARHDIQNFLNNDEIKKLLTAFVEHNPTLNMFIVVKSKLVELQNPRKTEEQIKKAICGVLGISEDDPIDRRPAVEAEAINHAAKAIYLANKGYTLEGGKSVAPELIKWLETTANHEHKEQVLKKTATWNHHDWQKRLDLLMSQLVALNMSEAADRDKARAVLQKSLFADTVPDEQLTDEVIRRLVGEARLVTYLQESAPKLAEWLKTNPERWAHAATKLGDCATEQDAKTLFDGVASAIANGDKNQVINIEGGLKVLIGNDAALAQDQTDKVWAECFLKQNEFINPSLILWLRAHPARWSKAIEKLVKQDNPIAWLSGLNKKLAEAADPATCSTILGEEFGVVLSDNAPVGDVRRLTIETLSLIKIDANAGAGYQRPPEGEAGPNHAEFFKAINEKCGYLKKLPENLEMVKLPNMANYLEQLQKIASSALADGDVEHTVQVREKLNRVKLAMQLMRDHWLKGVAAYENLLVQYQGIVTQIDKMPGYGEFKNNLEQKSKELKGRIKEHKGLIDATNAEIDKYNQRLMDVQEKLNAGPAGTQAISILREIHYMSDPIDYRLDAAGNFNISDEQTRAFESLLQKRREVVGAVIGKPREEEVKEPIKYLGVGQAIVLGADLNGKNYLTVLARTDADHFHLNNKQRPSGWTGYPGYRTFIKSEVGFILQCSDALHAAGKDSTITINDKDAKYVADMLEELQLQILIRASNGERSNIRVKHNIDNPALLRQVVKKAENRFKALDKEKRAPVASMEKLAEAVVKHDEQDNKPRPAGP